jgi:protein-S-isoprenylcysteine O-methyltransferase Ste14
MNATSWQSWLLVGLQFGIVGILVSQSDLEFHISSVACFVIGAGLGSWAVLTMGISNFNVVPDVRQNARFVHQQFPYRLIRHPMYVSLLIMSFGLVLQPLALIKLFEFMILSAVLDSKARYEEFLLRQRFPEYFNYQRNSFRFVPYLY